MLLKFIKSVLLDTYNDKVEAGNKITSGLNAYIRVFLRKTNGKILVFVLELKYSRMNIIFVKGIRNFVILN